MSELERIRKYIDRTKCRDGKYDATISEINLLPSCAWRDSR